MASNDAAGASTYPAINPNLSASVSASAGTGKTWLLVSRLVRLLIAGAKPDGILAITFTRKAAAEMQQRLSQRLLELATAETTELQQLLKQLDAPHDQQTLTTVSCLYEQLLHSPNGIQITTFHAFCQDILRRFPLEANVAPGFELLENTADLQQAAWDLLFNEASAKPNLQLASDLDTLFDFCGSVYSTRTALDNFLHHRSDWWALTESEDNSTQAALAGLERFFAIDSTVDPLTQFFSTRLISDIRQFAELLGRHTTSTNQKHVGCIHSALSKQQEVGKTDEAIELLKEAFLTKERTLRARKESGALKKSLGEQGLQTFLQLHHSIGEQLLQLLDQQARLLSLQANTAWYRCGARFLELYQQLKTEQRVLDFTDLEWKAYQLLNLADHAQWVQYKLDARINHFLIDEFQDTNPTQWQLIAPLLEELAGQEDDCATDARQRSAFIVGDSKQSIYRFRRADSKLFDTARDWLTTRLGAINQPLDKSWRSSPAIIDTVNKVFAHPELSASMSGFTPHSTQHQALWGRVEIFPLISAETDNTDEAVIQAHTLLRNPLHEPRVLNDDIRHYHEGQRIARTIRLCVDNHSSIGAAENAMALNYNHFMILLRNRTHAHAYEQALRELNIPYVGAERGTLLETLEVRDMLALLEILITPQNDLALAHTLRSPLFDCSNGDLIHLALYPQGNWMHRLKQLALGEKNDNLAYASECLLRWQALAGTLPVHDLLDRIYCEGNILQRYQAAYPQHLRQRVKANLTRFLELALEVDSGRYPSIGRFLARLQTLREQAEQAPDETPANLQDAHVRLMTIHAAKGLEAPVVFLADCTNSRTKTRSNQVLVHWPAELKQPQHMLLAGKAARRDRCTQELLDLDNQAESREDANLLYVAMTRARQCLYISGCKPNKGDDTGWYGLIRQQLANENEDLNQSIVLEFGSRPALHHQPAPMPQSAPLEINQQLTKPFDFTQSMKSIAPSEQATASMDELMAKIKTEDSDAQLRGRLIHRLLQLLSEGVDSTSAIQQARHEFLLPEDDALLSRCANEAQTVLQHPQLHHLFDASQYIRAYNEIPIQYRNAGKDVVGIIDRLVIHANSISLIDYKTHELKEHDLPKALAEEFRPQLSLYVKGIAELWPGKPIQPLVLFTHLSHLEPL